MDALLAVIRPKLRLSQNHDFRPRNFDIMLLASDKGKPVRQIPRISMPYNEDPPEYILKAVYQMTGADKGGLKGRRVLYVPPVRNEPASEHGSSRESYTKGALFCIPIDAREKLNPAFVDNVPRNPRFSSLDAILDSHNNPMVYSKQTKYMLRRLENWLRDKHAIAGFMEALFRMAADFRVRTVVTNPAYISPPPTSVKTGSQLDVTDIQAEEMRQTANGALAKMMAFEKCDIVVINPLFGSGLPYKNKVDSFAINDYWLMGKPDYRKIKAPENSIDKASLSDSWIEEYPLHKCAYQGDITGVRELLRKGYSVAQKDRDSWTPIHYAAWHGHLETVKILLREGECSPNIANDSNSTPLHFAALCGHCKVVEELLNHRDIDAKVKDKEGKMAVDLCEHVPKPDWQSCAKMIQKAMESPAPKVQVHLMDGTFRMLSLTSGANTTVQELHQQMIRELDIADQSGQLFTIWICSKYLQLQLKYEHKPVQHLNDWKRKIVRMLTDFDPQKEDPKLFWKRDARLSIIEERKVRSSVAIHLLFHEAYQNYIKSLYPCADEDAIILGALLLQLNQGDYDQKKAKAFFSNDKNLQTLIPVGKLKTRGMNWTSKLPARYKQVSLHIKDKTVEDLKFRFLTLCWNLTVYGSAFFTGYVNMKSSKSPVAVYIGVNDIGIHIIHGHNKMMLQSFNYTDIDWICDNEWATLQIRLKNAPRTGVSIRTKQAGLIYHLMSKLAQLHGATDMKQLGAT